MRQSLERECGGKTESDECATRFVGKYYMSVFLEFGQLL